MDLPICQRCKEELHNINLGNIKKFKFIEWGLNLFLLTTAFLVIGLILMAILTALNISVPLDYMKVIIKFIFTPILSLYVLSMFVCLLLQFFFKKDPIKIKSINEENIIIKVKSSIAKKLNGGIILTKS